MRPDGRPRCYRPLCGIWPGTYVVADGDQWVCGGCGDTWPRSTGDS